MSAPIKINNAAYLYFTGSFDNASGTASLFISGTGNVSSGAMPLFLQAKETKTESLSLYLAAISKTNSWESLGNQWSAYNISCSTGAPNFCQDWEYIPYFSAGTFGVKNEMTLFSKGAYRASISGAMPLFVNNSGEGFIDQSIGLFVYAENNELIKYDSITLNTVGHDAISSYLEMVMSGSYPNSSGYMTMFCDSYGDSTGIIKLFVSGI
jgi:hypothetical protein